MKKFSQVPHIDLDKIKGANLKPLTPDRQVKSIKMWIDQNVKKYGTAGGSDTGEEMQQFISDAGAHFGLYVDHPMFKMAVKQQKGWADEWKVKVVNKTGTVVDVDVYDKTLQGVLKKIVEDGGRGHHGNTVLSGSHGSCLHWVSGSVRIFGNFASNKLTLIGVGRHAGTNSTYNVDLVGGGTATART